jgi:hypothetical protein
MRVITLSRHSLREHNNSKKKEEREGQREKVKVGSYDDDGDDDNLNELTILCMHTFCV